MTLKINNYIYKRLSELGIPVSVTRDSDITLSPTDRVNKVLSFYGGGKDVIVVSNHINSGGGDGAEVIYSLRNSDTLSKRISNEIENAGQNVRKYYQRRLPSNPSKDYYFIMRDTPNTEAVIVEYGFLDSKGDDISQLQNNWEKYAEAVVKALVEYSGGKYVVSSNGDYYIVKSGDTLYSIAKKYGKSVDELKTLNNLSSNMLSIGQKLLVNNIEDNNYYIVQKGDSLWSISKKFNTTVDNLIKLNNLYSTNLSIGQKIIINGSNNGTEYIVVSGDTLYGIAKKFGVTVSDLININDLKSTVLSIGQKLIIPDN